MRSQLLLPLLALVLPGCTSYPYAAPKPGRIQVGRISVVPPHDGWLVYDKKEKVLVLGRTLGEDHHLGVVAVDTPFGFANLQAMADHLRNDPTPTGENIQRSRKVTELMLDAVPPCVEVRLQLEETGGKVAVDYNGIVRWYLPVDGGTACTLTFSERRAVTIAPADIKAEADALFASCQLHR